MQKNLKDDGESMFDHPTSHPYGFKLCWVHTKAFLMELFQMPSILIPSTNIMVIPKALLRHTYFEVYFNSLGSSFRDESYAQ